MEISTARPATEHHCFTARWLAATPTEPTSTVMLAHSAMTADALADGRVADACELLEAIPYGVEFPWIAQLVAAVVLPDRSAWNQHDTDTWLLAPTICGITG